MGKKPEIFLEHILAAIGAIEKFTKNSDEKKFMASHIEQSAVIRQFEIIGKAAKNIPAGFRKSHSDIPWKDMCGMRDKLIHEYFGVDLGFVWKTTKKDLPVLKNQIEEILESLNDNQKKLL